MIYIDTGVWIAQHTLEATTVAVQSWVDGQNVESFVCGQWVKTEYASALSIKRRTGALSESHFVLAHRRFADICVAGPDWVSVRDEDFFEAARLCADPANALRAGDALHLAIALRVGCIGFCTLDQTLNRNAAANGLQTFSL